MAKLMRDQNDRDTYTLRHTSCPNCNSYLSITENLYTIQKCPYCHNDLSNAKYVSKEYILPDKWIPFSTSFSDVKESLFKQQCKYNYAYFDAPSLIDISSLTKIYMPLYLFDTSIKYSYKALCEVPKVSKDKTIMKSFNYSGSGTEHYRLIASGTESNGIPTPILNWVDCQTPTIFSYAVPFKPEFLDNDENKYLVEVYGTSSTPQEALSRSEWNINQKAKECIKRSSENKAPSGGRNISIKSKNYSYTLNSTSSFMGAFWYLHYSINNQTSYFIFEGAGKSSDIVHIKSSLLYSIMWLYRLVVFFGVMILNNIYKLTSLNILFLSLIVIVGILLLDQYIYAIFRRIRFYKANKKGLLSEQYGLVLDIFIILLFPIILGVAWSHYGPKNSISFFKNDNHIYTQNESKDIYKENTSDNSTNQYQKEAYIDARNINKTVNILSIYRNKINQAKSNQNSDVINLIEVVNKIEHDNSLLEIEKLNKILEIYNLVVSKLKNEFKGENLKLLSQVTSIVDNQVQKLQEFGRDANLNDSEINKYISEFYYIKVNELVYISSKISWDSSLNYCKNEKKCNKYELSRINSYFGDNYNNLREVCQAGFCNEEILKEQERIWIEYSNKLSLLINKNSNKNNNNILLKTFLTINQNFVLSNVQLMFSDNIANNPTPFNTESFSTLFNSLATVQESLKQKTISEEKLKNLNAQLSTLIIPYLYQELANKGLDTKNLEVSAGAYDLSYRVFLVSSNRNYYGKLYDRRETELAKVEGKINRAKHALYLLLPDNDIASINTSNLIGFNCGNTPCSKDDFLRNGKDLEEIFANLKKQCELNKCISDTLFSQENNWISYTREWLKLLDKIKDNDDIKNHIKVLYDNDNINRLYKAYTTYQ